MAATAAASAAPTPLTALTTLGAVARNLTLLATRLHVGALIVSSRGRRGARCGFRRTWIDVALAWWASVVIPIVVASVAVTSIATAPLSLGPSAITVAAPLSAFGGAARLSGMLASAIALSVAAA